jgi:hypothetical protein
VKYFEFMYRADRETEGKGRGRSEHLVDGREKVCGESGSKVLAYRYDFLLCFPGGGK